MLQQNMKNSLDKIYDQWKEYQEKILLPEIISSISEYTKLVKKMNSIEDIIKEYDKYLASERAIVEGKEILQTEKDKEIRDMAKMDIEENESRLPEIIEKLKLLLLPKDPMDEKDVIVEIRGAAGGDEANIFALDLFRMYQKWISKQEDLKIEIMETQYSTNGGLVIVVFRVIGNKPFAKLKYETGSHRVQRIPRTEANGRIHTSTAVVTVIPEADEADEIKVKPDEIKIDTYRSSGAGGQSVNTTDSAIRITHIPSGVVVTSQDERSQVQNREKAMKILKARLYQLEIEKRQKEVSQHRLASGSGDRSEKIRTYNYPQNRITDHRISYTTNSLTHVMDGYLDPIIDALLAAEQVEKIKEANS